jgi:hypothetical protein
VLSDLFLHGIGGAKYDQVTDNIARQFFGFALPKFATVSATLRLPIVHAPPSAVGEGDLARQMRELRYHPERFVARNGRISTAELTAIEPIIATKLRWVETIKTSDNAQQRHDAIAAANQAMQPFVAEWHRELERQREEFAHRKRASVILDSREYSFCLHPRRHFEQLLLDGPRLLP